MSFPQGFLASQASQSSAASSSNYTIGDIKFDTERGTSYQRGGKTYLRSGSVLSASSYGLASTDSGLMVNGVASTLPANVAVTGFDTNGTGTWIAAYGHATNVLISTDNMLTWTTKAHNNANSVCDVKWNPAQSKFITFGSSATQITCSNSPTGATFTAAGSLTPGVVPVAGTVRATCDGTTILCAWQSTSANTTVATTTDGATLTSRTLSASIAANKQPLVASCISLGVARWLVAQESGTAAFYVSTASDASAWQSAGNPNITGGTTVGVCGGSNFFTAVFSNGATLKTTNGTTWTQSALPAQASAIVATTDMFAAGGAITFPNWLYFDGTRVITGTALSTTGLNAAQGLFGYTTDGDNWYTRQLTYPCSAVAGAQLAGIEGNGSMGTPPSGVANQMGE